MVDPELSATGSFQRYVEFIPVPFALTRGDGHALVFANAAFRVLVALDGQPGRFGIPISDAFTTRDISDLRDVLDRAFRTGDVARNQPIAPLNGSALSFNCTVWPVPDRNGATEHLVIELRPATQGESTLALQREVSERLLLSALREQDAAEVSEESRRGAAFLSAQGRRLAESLDESATLSAMKRMSLSRVGDWCIVDTLGDDDTMHRLAIIHPDPAKHAILAGLEGRWKPEPDDSFGLPAVLRSATPTVVTDNLDAALTRAAHAPEILRDLNAVGIGPLLTVPLLIRDRLIGAVTFVSGQHDRTYTQDDIELAEGLASRSATALDRARAYGEAIVLRDRAESANQAKSAFLGMMSHELRTPLNAIGGYVDLLDLEIHGPVTAEQRVDLGRIRSNQQHLMGLISDVLNLTSVAGGHVTYGIVDLRSRDVIDASIALVEPLIARRKLTCERLECDELVTARGDPERVIQILVNFLSNAIKFTSSGGRLTIDCNTTADAVMLRVSDSGIGIARDKLNAIFEPFFQVKASSSAPESGIGLGLAISRTLARAMHGDITVESVLGEGSRFTLTLPRATATA